MSWKSQAWPSKGNQDGAFPRTGFNAKGQVTLTSGNWIGPSHCVHSQMAVWLPQQNFVAKGSGVSMPSLVSCKGKCVDTANPGIEAAKLEMNLNLPKVSDHISKILAATMATSSTLKTEVLANKPLASSQAALTTAKITTKSQEVKLVRGSVVTSTAAHYNDLKANTNGYPPGGLPTTWTAATRAMDRPPRSALADRGTGRILRWRHQRSKP